jgi:DNA-binding protein HU-beta
MKVYKAKKDAEDAAAKLAATAKAGVKRPASKSVDVKSTTPAPVVATPAPPAEPAKKTPAKKTPAKKEAAPKPAAEPKVKKTPV